MERALELQAEAEKAAFLPKMHVNRGHSELQVLQDKKFETGPKAVEHWLLESSMRLVGMKCPLSATQKQ